MKKVNIIGVPEHFNLPWHMAIEEGAFANRGIDLVWKDIPEGTGRMAQMLKDGDTDLAIILTEGIVKSIHDGNAAKIVQEYIKTPLLWGIHVGFHSPYQSLEQLKDTKAAISRFGSGSHLMAYVNAQNQQWDTEKLKFEVVHHLDGAVAALTQGKADYFMWERFTTKPLVDNRTFRRLADCPTPWPCFVIAATQRFLKHHQNVLHHILEVIHTYTSEFKKIPSIDRTIANRYGQRLADVKEWLSITEWGQAQLTEQALDQVQQRLYSLGLIKQILPHSDVIA
ncbi:ABC-type nitrate/sulfonate/bicarbonate transport system, periplasmic component [Croceitalea dokdonensis DOKDO 023]|uniref:ABC-type nitrate/sulfonate/bicarbonate transport system, periplasmic component n=1 Tax=Croceitalea dokdonensis DOKDO 023 TaxID=1300341 RepID=A0A0P7AN87_9FLAO|nr:substrate-binding domain-containing protein [Croceitalea dokdonensis]KPM33386.1 ABC-type nitrate/sulfonate/bicarbonate transport system, periplasmic component [Croceitalea dokdonensis DOKDO 023]